MLNAFSDEPQRSNNVSTDYPRAQYLLMWLLVHVCIDRIADRAAKLGPESKRASTEPEQGSLKVDHKAKLIYS